MHIKYAAISIMKEIVHKCNRLSERDIKLQKEKQQMILKLNITNKNLNVIFTLFATQR